MTTDSPARASPGPPASRLALRVLFTLTLFVSAALLFLVQPMFAKMVLPLLGGTPSVWNTSMLFFQGVLLAGYAYAHWGARRWGVRRQALVHLALLVPPLLLLPLRVPSGWRPPEEGEVLWLLALLAVALGLPFFVVSASSPMLQRWFGSTGHPAAADPYFLYRASNLGSMLALLAYPLAVEPLVDLEDQGRLWGAGYVVLAALTAGCTLGLRRFPFAAPPAAAPAEAAGGARRLLWVALAFVPTSYTLAVTTHLSTDIAAVPLLWVVPLSLYLLSFILAFARGRRVPVRIVARLQAFVLVPLLLIVAIGGRQPPIVPIVAHLLAFFVAAWLCHGRLAEDRPPATRLTEFYLCVALGGVLGGAFVALAAPVLFDGVHELPLAILLATLLRPPHPKSSPRARALDVALPILLGLVAAAVLALDPARPVRMAALGIGALCVFSFSERRVRFALGLGALALAGAVRPGTGERALFADRTFFGVHRVVEDGDAGLRKLIHGTTVHGAQSTDPGRAREPLTYYHRTGPAGQIMTDLGQRPGAEIGVVGLGTGSLACYARPDQRWTFFEIDPAVERLARDRRLFSYLPDCLPAARVVLGDARLSLAEPGAGRYAILLIDAFTSDAIPVHLLTREAVRLYADRLEAGGVLGVHISNRYLDLEPVIGRIVADLGLSARLRHDGNVSAAEAAEGKTPSVWVAAARRPGDLGPIASDARWRDLRVGAALWTDDFSNIAGAFRWR